MGKKVIDDETEYLFRGILTLKTVEDCRAFFEDLCTVKELSEMSRRLTAAKMLDGNKIYNEIAEETGLSTATISRVNRSLSYGCDGYQVVFDRVKDEGKDEGKAE